MAQQRPKTAPGPRGSFLFGNLFEFRRDVLGLIIRSREKYGDIVRVNLGPLVVHMLCHPRQIEQVLKDLDRYDKSTLSSRVLSRVSGESLLVSNGALWQRQRRLMQPAFSPKHTADYVDSIAQATSQMLERWTPWAGANHAFDVASEMMRLTYRIVEQVLFSSSASEDLSAIEGVITVALERTYHQIERGGIVPTWLPTPTNWKFRKALRTLDERIYELIRQHRQGAGKGDLLSMLIEARDETTGEAMPEKLIRDEAIALMIAGHETTANAMTWFWYLLAQHPEIAEQLRIEVRTQLGDRLPTAQDLEKLPQVRMAVLEAMRIYPPIWSIIRRVTVPHEIEGYHMPLGSRIVISPYATHRHPDFWPDAERFDPSRFESANVHARDHYAYIPFGGGPRICIGQNLAKVEAVVIAAMVLQKYRLRLVPGHPVEMLPGITLRARHGMRMMLEPA